MQSEHTYSPIRITVLGSGTCVPSLQRSSCAVLMEIDQYRLLFDCGPGTMHRLLAAGVTLDQITHLFLTHFHPDHCGELISFLFASKYGNLARRKAPLVLLAGSGFGTFFHYLHKAFGKWIDLDSSQLYIVELATSSEEVTDFGKFRVQSMPVNHNPESLAYRVSTSGGESVVYTGDSDMCEALVTVSQNADLLICESALPDELKSKGHLTPSHAGDIATRAQVEQLMLIHFYPECEQADITGQCRKTWQGPLILAQDLMQLTVTRANRTRK